jgi:VWFA-related protein
MKMSGMVALFVLVLLVPRGYAQTPLAPATDRPTIVSNADEVTLDLMVRDKKNKPVLDLKPDDISVKDNGSAVRISNLRLISGQSGAEHLISFVFNPLEPAAATNARDIAKKILKLIPDKGFSFSVLTVNGRLHLLQGFTSDRAAVSQAIGDATERDERGRVNATALSEKNLITVAESGADNSETPLGAGKRALSKVLLNSLQESQRIVQDQHCLPSLAGLLALARAQSQIPGRKIVIYFEQGRPLDSNAKDMLPSIAGAANRASVSIYAVDANAVDEQSGQGLLTTMAIGGVIATNRMNPAPTGAETRTAVPRAPPGSITAGNDSLGRIETEGLSGYQNPLAQLAADTGGAYIASADNLKKPLRQLVEDLTTYYEASYVPPSLDYDGKFRPVTVEALRSGLKMRSRPGYFAVPPAGRMRPFEIPLMKLFSEPQLPTDLKFHSAVLRLGALPTGNENALIVEVPLTELETRNDPNSNLYSLHVSIVAQIKNKAGEVIEHFSEDVPRHGALDSKGTAQAELITMQRSFLAEPGQYVAEVAILDRNNEKAGAERIDFEIPGEATGPSLSDVTIVQRTDVLPAEMDSAEPLRYGTGKIIPGISGLVPHGVKEISFFFILHPDPNSAEPSVLEMQVLKSNETIAQVPLHLPKTNGSAAIPYLASIKAASLPSGDYQVIEKLTQGGKSTERSLSFRIKGPELAAAITPDETTRIAPPTDGAEGDATSPSPLPATEGQSRHDLVITSLPAGTVPAPTPDELEAIVAGARKRALDYIQSLPNFICLEVTSRSVDQSGNGNWKHRDSIAELLTYHDNEESRSTLAVNGKRSNLKRAEMNSTWPTSIGEFGSLLNLVFATSSKTRFEWKEAGTLGDGAGPLQILSYCVAPENATLNLRESNNTIGVGFHGLVYIDNATSGIRRVTVEADGLPRNFSMHAAAMTVDYDYVAISGRDYLLPVRSTVSLQRHRRQVELNEIVFQNYRRFAARTKIKMIQ